MIELHRLTPVHGHKRLFFDEVSPEKRKELAEHIDGIIKLGHAVFIQTADGDFQVQGYDAEKNEWILKKRRGRPRKAAAAGDKATEVPARAGG